MPLLRERRGWWGIRVDVVAVVAAEAAELVVVVVSERDGMTVAAMLG